MRRWLVMSLTLVASLMLLAASAQAMVVNVSGRQYGIAAPWDATPLTGPPAVTSPSPCADPWLAPDLLTYPTRLADGGLCYHGGAVMHANETFVLTWDPTRSYYVDTKFELQQFLKDVADASGGLGTPYAVTMQFHDSGGRATTQSKYGGACIDYGSAGQATCDYTGTTTTGSDYPSGACKPQTSANCTLTDDQLRTELAAMITRTQLASHTQTGYTPLVVLLTPPDVEVCLDSGSPATVCSANSPPSGAKATFCSYHGQLSAGGMPVSYVVQPFTAFVTGCYSPNADKIDPDMSFRQKATIYGERMTDALSRSHIAAIVNPAMNGWFGLSGIDTTDGGCVPSLNAPKVKVGSGSYPLEGALNNAGVLEMDPWVNCVWGVTLQARFVAPSPIDAGDVVLFDGSTTASTLMVPKAGYVWNFGDGTGATGTSILHTFATSGVYPVKLTVTDRGGNIATITQQVTVTSGGISPPPPNHQAKLKARLALIPQSYTSMLRSGIALRVTSNEPADGFSTILISRSAAKRAHLRTGRSANVVVARGTVSGIKNGTVKLHLRLASSVTKKLARLGHLKLTIKLSLIGASGAKATIDAAGSY